MSRIHIDLTGKTTLVTGGASGIGRGFALQMARNGAAVAVADLNGAAAEGVAEEIRASGGRALSYQVNVSDYAAVQAMTDDVITRFGQLDFLFANAGVLGPSDYFEITPEDWDLTLDVNVKGVAYTCRAAAAHMKERREGRILITASYNAVRTGPHVIPYRVSKAAALM